MNKNYFFDIHCHAMNFSHPNLFAFLKRKWTIAMLASPLAPIATTLFKGKVKKVENLFSLMENDIADFFLIMEYFLKNWLDSSPLNIGNTTYNKIVLTPLMMDFGCKDIKSDSFYNIAPKKPIVEQVVDVFNGIKKYCENELQIETKKYISKKKEDKLFEIYPFLGINTKNYEPEDKNASPELYVKALLNKYFKDYNHDRESLFKNMGGFDGNIDNMGSNFFAGIKVYPPLGFDPWPEDENELARVKCLYQYCCDKKIPITTHCSEGGFALDNSAEDYTSPAKWKTVLANPKFEKLRLNFAHFGRQDKILRLIPKKEWENIILELIATKENVYADFSYRGCDDGYYNDLKKLIDRQSDKDRLKQRILFGSDFMINLLDIDSYNQYINGFVDKENPITTDDRALFCSTNPERFLFG